MHCHIRQCSWGQQSWTLHRYRNTRNWNRSQLARSLRDDGGRILQLGRMGCSRHFRQFLLEFAKPISTPKCLSEYRRQRRCLYMRLLRRQDTRLHLRIQQEFVEFRIWNININPASLVIRSHIRWSPRHSLVCHHCCQHNQSLIIL